MNVVKEINQINLRELATSKGTDDSWHADYKDSAYIFVGGLNNGLTEGDVITVFSQFGEIADINLPKDKETGKSRGFAFIMYLDQRSTVLAVDNLNGAKVGGRTLRVDHTKNYEQPKTKDADGEIIEPDAPSMNAMPSLVGGPSGSRGDIRGQEDNGRDDDDVDLEDPMAAYIRQERLRESQEGSGSSALAKPKKDKHKKDKSDKKEKKRDKSDKKEKRYRDRDSYERDGERERQRRRTSSRSRSRSPSSSRRRDDGRRSVGYGRDEAQSRDREERMRSRGNDESGLVARSSRWDDREETRDSRADRSRPRSRERETYRTGREGGYRDDGPRGDRRWD